jgi:hypothetical protein
VEMVIRWNRRERCYIAYTKLGTRLASAATREKAAANARHAYPHLGLWVR